MALAAALINLFALGVTLFSMAVYDRVIPNNAMHSLAALTAGVGILLASDFLLRRLRAHVLDVAGARVDRVEALVVEQGLEYSLLGMSYLGRLSAFSATPAGLTLRP